MNATSHTPGPWKVSHSVSHNGFTIWTDNGNRDEAYISVFCAYSGKDEKERRAKAKADADLVAAAPDLLRLAYQYRDDLHHPPSADSRHRRIEAIESLIAKATGGAL